MLCKGRWHTAKAANLSQPRMSCCLSSSLFNVYWVPTGWVAWDRMTWWLSVPICQPSPLRMNMQDPSLNGLFIITKIACILVIKCYFARFWYLSIWYTSDQKYPSHHWILLASELCQEALCRSWPESVSWPFISYQLQITHLCSGGLRGGEFVVLMSSMLLTSNMTSVCLGLHCHLYHLLFFFLFFCSLALFTGYTWNS